MVAGIAWDVWRWKSPIADPGLRSLVEWLLALNIGMLTTIVHNNEKGLIRSYRRKGPEFPFPQAVHDIYDSIKWVSSPQPLLNDTI